MMPKTKPQRALMAARPPPQEQAEAWFAAWPRDWPWNMVQTSGTKFLKSDETYMFCAVSQLALGKP